MSALPTAPAATRPSSRAPRRPRGLLWTVLRLHRPALIVWVLASAAIAGYLIRLYALGDEARAGMSVCGSPGTGLPLCSAVDAITADETYTGGLSLMATAVSYLMFPVAAWAGGALIGRELESGTADLAWTQSVTPTRWLATRLAVPAVPITSGTGVLVLVHNWARQDGDPNLTGDWYYPDVFLATGPAAVAYALAGLALGAFAGMLTRRALPAAGLGFGAALVLYNALNHYREDLWPQVTRPDPTGPDPTRIGLPRSVWQTGNESGTGAPSSFHPQSHRWPLHLMETGIVLAVAVAATAAAFALLRRRTA
ncbi:hypothetical protein [Streptomyces acidicola]|uniref:ABC transporter permease n=1 Tax=Streptomyces acidicola TaxID=2596892 RepID=A0A5N8X7F8_9ACTN|nr:hypothetical protein [Streptomyces acidicola]MPY55332.1 hypothetical protein [Streptomyces acidicola]